MQSLITKKQNILKLTKQEIELLVLDSFAIKCEVIKNEHETFILLNSYQSCFKLMERLHFDFDFIVHKKKNKYIIEVKNG